VTALESRARTKTKMGRRDIPAPPRYPAGFFGEVFT